MPNQRICRRIMNQTYSLASFEAAVKLLPELKAQCKVCTVGSCDRAVIEWILYLFNKNDADLIREELTIE